MHTPILFEEIQHFRQKWFWWLMIAMNAFLITGFFANAFIHHEVNNDTSAGLLTAIFVIAIITLLLHHSGMVTQVRSDGIYVKVMPFHSSFKFFSWHSIDQVYIRTYNPITEYGGWGMRHTLNGVAFNVTGNIGLQLVFNNGAKLLIGTQQPEQLAAALIILGKLTPPPAL